MSAGSFHSQLPLSVHATPFTASRRVGLSIRLLSVGIVFCTALALSRVRLGPIPLYFEDVLIALVLTIACSRSEFARSFLSPFGALAICFLGFIALSELWGVAFHGSPFEPIYMLGRFALSVVLIGVMPAMIRSDVELDYVLRGFVVGMLITSVLAICTSIPPTRSLVNATVFSIPLLGASAGDRALDDEEQPTEAKAGRGRSLVGSINITGGVLCTIWPLSFLAFRRLKLHWKTLALWACVVTPFGAMATYARGAWLGIALILCVVCLAGYGKGRLHVAIATILAIIVISTAGVSSNLFFFERIIERTQVAIYDRGGSENERLYSYVEPFQKMVETPTLMVMGTGLASQKMARRGAKIDDTTMGQHNHSVFSEAFYCFGGVAAFCHAFLMVGGYLFIIRRLFLVRYQSIDEKLPWQVALACFLGMTPWWMFGHGIISEPRGSIVFFLMFGMLMAFERRRRQSVPSLAYSTPVRRL